jgi:hypothetical protein
MVVAEGDYVVQFGMRDGQWPGGEFMESMPRPGPYARDFAATYRFRYGRIAERWAVGVTGPAHIPKLCSPPANSSPGPPLSTSF